MYFNSKRFYKVVYFVLIFVCIGGFIFGYIYTAGKIKNSQIPYRTNSLEGTNTKISETEETQNVINQNVSSNTNLTKKYFYTGCHHTVVQDTKAPNDMLNLSEEQFRIAYKDWNIEKFSPSQIIISKSVNGKCPYHYVVKIKDGEVAVFYQVPIAGVSLKELTNIDVSSLPKADQTRLKQGIIVNSNEELAELLEDLGS